MDMTDLIGIITILTLIRTLFGILADAPKAWETISKGWNVVSLVAWSVQKKTYQYKIYIKQMLAWTATSPPVNISIASPCGALRLNVFDTVNMGLNDGYPAFRHRQNTAAYYYSQGETATATPFPLR